MKKISLLLLVPIWALTVCFAQGCFANSQSHRAARVVDATQSGRTQMQKSHTRPSQAQSAAPQAVSARTPRPYAEPVSGAAQTYTVKNGDTLYSIAFRFNQDYKTLASLNGIEPPYAIYQGQVLQVGTPSMQTASGKTAVSTPAASNLPLAVPLAEARAQKEQAAKKGQKTLKYKVQTGDSVNSVARSYEISINDLVRANHLTAPYYLKRGSTITIPLLQAKSTAEAPKSAATKIKPLSTTTIVTEHGTTIRDQVVAQKEELVPVARTAPKIVRTRANQVDGIAWQWPASGKVIRTFSTAERGSKGIDIRGNYAQNVMSAADGEVVYAGNALRGYGNLLIVNHAREYLSAYAHNEQLLVKEGDKVKRGQVIARMGSTDADQVMLHFEIRHKGSSLDPQKFLP